MDIVYKQKKYRKIYLEKKQKFKIKIRISIFREEIISFILIKK